MAIVINVSDMNVIRSGVFTGGAGKLSYMLDHLQWNEKLAIFYKLVSYDRLNNYILQEYYTFIF